MATWSLRSRLRAWVFCERRLMGAEGGQETRQRQPLINIWTLFNKYVSPTRTSPASSITRIGMVYMVDLKRKATVEVLLKWVARLN
ncbi:hypothetical protein NDU88_005384 [Pleurodeles waltl]|uniref:Uncharacterized protein n=1 Tax=Pleurodeles waltl TaxID=8319 RepID=A0AAV7PK80_PLEWA|nr:hypothetical protein NDU88_005384 [Pleurodeles waltl]